MPTVRSILIVHGTHDGPGLLQDLLSTHYEVRSAKSGEDALRLSSSGAPPDLILLVLSVPGLDAYAVCRKLKAASIAHNIPVIMLDSQASEANEEMSFACGAADYIVKTVSPRILLARVQASLSGQRNAGLPQEPSELFERAVAARTRELTSIQNATILAIAILAETRDADTGNHLRRTQRYVRALAWKLSSHPRFSGFLTPGNVALLYSAAPLHDIGKVAIPDRILLKPGKLTPEEFDVMKTHTTLGRDAIGHAEEDLDEDVAFLKLAKEIAFSHQEKWDGSGYPQGLKGDEIPPSARLMALADVYDALVSKRVYRDPMPHAQAVQVIEQVSGRHFDPDIVQAFLAIHETFETIALAFADSDADLQPKVDYLKIVQGDAT